MVQSQVSLLLSLLSSAWEEERAKSGTLERSSAGTVSSAAGSGVGNPPPPPRRAAWSII